MMQRSLRILSLATAVATAQPQFVSLPPAKTGIAWKHDNAKSKDRHLPETVGPGIAVLDYDHDGWMDLYFVNSGAADFYSPPSPLRNALYRNNRDGTFTDMTIKAGVAGGGFGMGASAADYDGDGYTDLLVTNYGRNILYRNLGDGTFRDVTAAAGISGEGWWTSAVWYDFDRDGKIDLFIANYVEYRKELVKLCFDDKLNVSAYCVPRLFNPTKSRLYRNRGNGTFEDVSESSGVANYAGKAFGAVATDIDNDGWPDLFVASDMAPNALFLNRKDGTFEDIGLNAGVAYSEGGDPRSGMGADAADFDGDGWQDLFVANIDQQYFSLYRNLRNLTFREMPGEVRRDTRLLSGWGLKFFDYDNDGDPDLMLANGHPDDMIDRRMPGVTYAEPLLLFENRGGSYVNVGSTSGNVFSQRFNARGLATVDLDNDGDLDVVIGINGGAPLILSNDGGNRQNWIGLTGHLPEGTHLEWTAGGKLYKRVLSAGGSFLSSHDPRQILGLGTSNSIEAIDIKWTSGQSQRLEPSKLGRYLPVKPNPITEQR